MDNLMTMLRDVPTWLWFAIAACCVITLAASRYAWRKLGRAKAAEESREWCDFAHHEMGHMIAAEEAPKPQRDAKYQVADDQIAGLAKRVAALEEALGAERKQAQSQPPKPLQTGGIL